MLSIIAFLFVLSVVMFIHEFGHFIVARRLGVKVEEFSIFGWPPKLFTLYKGQTEYIISAIPIGAYVKIAGEDPTGKVSGEPWEFMSRSVFDRFRIIVAGPLFNYLLAFVIFSLIFMVGSPTLTTEVGGLMNDYPAKASGLAAGDRIVAIDGKAVSYWEDMTEAIHKHTGGPMTLSVERGSARFEKSIQPVVRRTKDIFGNQVSIALIGITPSQRIDKVTYGFPQSFVMGGKKLVQLTAVTYKALWSIITGRLSVKESLTGPVGMFVISGQAAKLGFIYLMHLMGVLSASLAIFNLLPLPVLDGGHIVLMAIEKVRGRPLSLKAQNAVSNVGWTLIWFLVAYIFYIDIMKFGVVDKIMKLFRH